MDDFFKLRAYYFAENRDTSEIVRESEDITTEGTLDVHNQETISDHFSWKPEKMLTEHKMNRTDPIVQQKFFHCIVNKVSD